MVKLSSSRKLIRLLIIFSSLSLPSLFAVVSRSILEHLDILIQVLHELLIFNIAHFRSIRVDGHLNVLVVGCTAVDNLLSRELPVGNGLKLCVVVEVVRSPINFSGGSVGIFRCFFLDWFFEDIWINASPFEEEISNRCFFEIKLV